MDFAVSLKNTSKIFVTGRTQVKAISDVSFDIPEESFWVIAGPSGSGKTTLLNLIGGLDRATSGEVVSGTLNLTRMDEQDLALYRRRRVGFIFQGNNLITSLTAFENIEIPLILTGASQRKTKVMAILDEIGLSSKHHMFPQYLSAGEQQRVAVARAVVHSPKIVLADEPTANLDTRTGSEILALLQRLNRKLKRTILLSTHDPRIIENSKHVLWLSDGRLQHQRPPTELATDKER
jgi:putative ABC transport system ATP-binding protein